MKDMPIVHDCSYFENDAEFYWEPAKLFEGRSDMRPTTKAENLAFTSSYSSDRPNASLLLRRLCR